MIWDTTDLALAWLTYYRGGIFFVHWGPLLKIGVPLLIAEVVAWLDLRFPILAKIRKNSFIFQVF